MIKIQDSGHKTQDSRLKTQDSLLATVLCLVSCIFLFWGCSEPKDKIVIPPEDKLPSVKEPLKAYHPTEFLSTEIRSAPILSQASHPDGWKKTDCTQCHRSPSKEAPAICTDCHGKNGVGDQVDTCRSCHKVQSEFGEPASGNHQAHVIEGPKDTSCIKCHTGGPDQSKSHANGILDIRIINDGKYTSLTTPQNGVTGSCSNIICHPDVRNWGGDCSSCHYDPPDTGLHEEHLEQENISCQACHLGNKHDSDKTSGEIELGGIDYNSITGDCTSTCHSKPLNWTCTDCHGYPPDTGNHTSDDHKVGCGECHSGHTHSYKAATRPLDFSETEVRFAQGGTYRYDAKSCSSIACHSDERIWGSSCTDCHANPPDTSTHLLHVQGQGLECQDCHSGNQHDLDNQSGSIETGGIVYDSLTGDCTSTCHDEQKWDCTDCHGFPPDSGNHLAHDSDCGECHQGHEHSYKAALEPTDFTEIQVSIADGGQFNSSNNSCNNLSCHETRTWGENCAACHLNPPRTGTHLLHVQEQKLSCQNCHEGNQHDSDVNSGSIELGGIGYNAFTGDCTSTCHGQRQWNCTECHGNPPDTGNHPGHEHSYRAAMSPRDFSSIQVDFIVSGSFDPGSKTCSNVECHTDARFWGENCAACHLNPPETGTHLLHVREQKLSCQNCHEGNQHDLDVNSGSIELGGIEYDALTGDCFSSCHAERRWNCIDCHEYPPETGTHPSHNQPSGKFFSLEELGAGPTPCAECHLGHIHSYKAAMAPEEFFPIQVDFERGGIFNPTNGICSNLACHESMKWGGSCSDCHGAPPETGLHQIHIQAGLNCTLCHEGNQHDLDVNSGFIDIGGTASNLVYEESTGSCTSSCHAKKELWDCTSCHGYPPDAGQHEAHDQFACTICHVEHRHTYKSATSPLDFGDVKVGFAIGGNWDKVTGTCNSIGCHEDRNW
jgi:hypothetical protein